MTIEWIEQYMHDAERMIIEGGQKLEIGITMLNDLLYDEPGYGNLHNHLGWAYLYYTPDQARAEVHLKAAIKFKSEFQAPYLHLGTLYLRQEKYAEAIAILETGLTKPQANKAVMFDMIGQAYEMTRQYRLAIKSYKDAMLASMNTGEMNMYSASVKRCRTKRWKAIF